MLLKVQRDTIRKALKWSCVKYYLTKLLQSAKIQTSISGETFLRHTTTHSNDNYAAVQLFFTLNNT